MKPSRTPKCYKTCYTSRTCERDFDFYGCPRTKKRNEERRERLIKYNKWIKDNMDKLVTNGRY